jgi:hypothetical protein
MTTPSETFKFHTKDIHFETCPSHFKLSILPSHTSGLHELLLKKICKWNCVLAIMLH